MSFSNRRFNSTSSNAATTISSSEAASSSSSSLNLFAQSSNSLRFSLPNSVVLPAMTTSTRPVPSVLRRRLIRPTFSSTDQDIDTNGLLENAVIVESLNDDGLETFSVDGINDNNYQIDTAQDLLDEDDVEFSSNQNSAQLQKSNEVAATSSKNVAISSSLQTIEFSFLDNKNVCCGLCGEIVPYDQLMSEHLPNNHPEILSSSSNIETTTTVSNVEENSSTNVAAVEQQQQTGRPSNETWLKEKLSREKRSIESGFKMSAYRSAVRAPTKTASIKRYRRLGDEPARKVSTIRVNPRTMSLPELELALKKKMFEKLNRQVPVTLMDKLHARCGLCNAIISLNKKFEIIHLVRHFNCWHPTVHACAGSWQMHQSKRRSIRPLSIHDFAVIDTGSGSPDSLQCIWCGMFVEAHCLAQHFGELHSDDVEVPKCNLCMQELILTARYQEKFNMEIQITLPDEHHMKCNECDTTFSSEVSLDNHIQRRHVAGISAIDDPQADVDDVNLEEIGPEAFSNSRMTLGKRRRPKRQFIMPALRQAVPLDSEYVEPIAECHWKCKLCEGDIYGAVISAAAIRHFKYGHPDHADNMQYEICKSRLEKVSDSCMEFIHPQLIECLLCQQSFNLHQPFNMCRAIRHLKAKHPNLMPEYAGLSQFDDFVDEDYNVVTNAVLLRRDDVGVLGQLPIVFSQGNELQDDLEQETDHGQMVVYENEVQGTGVGVDEEEDDGEEIIVAQGQGGTICFDNDATSYTQQFMTGGHESHLSTPLIYPAKTEIVSQSINVAAGIRVFRTPQQVRSYYDPNSYQNMMAAKNARLDHGAIARPFPPELQRHQSLTIVGNQILDQQLLDQTQSVPVVFHQQQQSSRQYYLLLQTPTDESTSAGQQVLLDSSMVVDMDRNMEGRSSEMNVMVDDSMMESQRLTELMSQAREALAASNEEHNRQEHVLMSGDDLILN